MIAIGTMLRRRVRARWFKTWNAALDGALNTLPETDCCPRELYRLLCTRADPHKAYALVEDAREGPVSVACLRRRESFHDWVPVTHHIVPGIIFPVARGRLPEVVSALHRDMWLDWWRMGDYTSQLAGVRSVETGPTFGLEDPAGCEEYWHKTHYLQTVKRSARKCEGLVLRTNAPGMGRWLIENWERKWRPAGAPPRGDLEDKIAAAEYLERVGRSYVFTLHEGDRPAAGVSVLIHHDAAVAQYSYRDPEFDSRGAGTCLVADVAKWAAEAGLKVDLGTAHDEHKCKVGEITGSRSTVHVCPRFQYAFRAAQEIVGHMRAQGLGHYLKALVAKVTHAGPHPVAAH